MVARARHARWLAALLALAALLVCETASGQSVRASVNRDAMTTDETLTLQIVVQAARGATVGSPEGSDFVVQNRSVSTSRTIRNGQSSATTRVSLSLRPTRTGDLTVGRVPVRLRSGVEYTQTFPVQVRQGRQRPASNATQARRATGVPPPPRAAHAAPPPPRPGSEEMTQTPMPEVEPGTPFLIGMVTAQELTVGGQVIVDYVLLSPRMAFGLDAVELTEPEWGNVWFREITDVRTGGNTRLGSTVLNGESYDVQVIRSYVVVPMEAGAFSLPDLSLELEMNSFRQRGNYSVRTTPLELRVSPPPVADAPEGFAAPNVGRFELRAVADRAQARVGEAVQLTLRLEGTALFSRVRGPAVPTIEGAEVLEPNDSTTIEIGPDGWAVGSWTRRVTIVPGEEGELRIPAVRFPYYDPTERAFAVAESEPVRIRVAGFAERQVLPEAVAIGTEWAEDLPAPPELSEAPPAEPSRAHASPAFVAAAAAAPLTWLTWLLGSALRKRKTRRAPERRRERAGVTAHAALDACGDDAARVGDALREYLSQRLDAPVRGARVSTLEGAVSARYGEALAARCAALVREAELSRYGGGGDVHALTAEARALIDALEER